MQVKTLFVFVSAAVLAAAADRSLTAADFAPEQAARDARILRSALTEMHPGLTKYRTAPEIETAMQKWDQRAGAARTRGEMYLAAAELTAAIQCGHTWPQPRNNQDETVLELLNANPDKLPCLFTVAENRWRVNASTVDSLQPGDEILAVDAVPVNEISSRLLPYLRADGAANHKRLDQIDHRWTDRSMFDYLWPLLQPSADGRRQLRIMRNGHTTEVAAETISFATRLERLKARGYHPPNEDWRLDISAGGAVMTLPTFAHFGGQFDGKAWLRDAFDRLHRESVQHLILDLRANEGGADALAEELLSYFLRQPLIIPPGRPIGAYERVPYVLARFLETWDYDFFDRTGRVEKLGDHQYLLKYRMEEPRRIEPQTTPFTGRVVALIGPRNSSATSVLARRLQEQGLATLVGQPTGGNRRGLNGGEIAWVRLPNSGVAVDIPLVAQNPAQPEPDASTVPDVAVVPTFAALQNGIDEALVVARRTLGTPSLP